MIQVQTIPAEPGFYSIKRKYGWTQKDPIIAWAVEASILSEIESETESTSVVFTYAAPVLPIITAPRDCTAILRPDGEIYNLEDWSRFDSLLDWERDQDTKRRKKHVKKKKGKP